MNDPADLIQLTSTGRELIASAIDQDSPLRGLAMVGVFSGHLDAGNLADQVQDILLDSLEHETLASFDIDRLIDYRARRPHVTFDGERFTDYKTPELKLHLVKDQSDRPFLLLSGHEPDYQWERFVGTVQMLIDQLQISSVALIDAVPMPVPHTRPMGVTTHGNKEELLAGLSTWSPQARMLAGVAQLLEVRLHEAHTDVTGYTLHVPHYLADATYPQAAVAALEYLGAELKLRLPTEELREAARQVEAQITEETARSPEIQAMVQGLEQRFDKFIEEHGQARSLLMTSDEQIPDAEEIGAAFEDFLSEAAQQETDQADDSNQDEAKEDSDSPSSASEQQDTNGPQALESSSLPSRIFDWFNATLGRDSQSTSADEAKPSDTEDETGEKNKKDEND